MGAIFRIYLDSMSGKQPGPVAYSILEPIGIIANIKAWYVAVLSMIRSLCYSNHEIPSVLQELTISRDSRTFYFLELQHPPLISQGRLAL